MKLFSTLFVSITAFISSLVGKFSWENPPWMNHLRNMAATQPRKFWGGILIVLIFSTGIVYGLHWYQSLPQPERVTANIITPQLTPVDKILIPDKLTLDFGVIREGELNSRSVAPLNLVGKNVTDNMSITPFISGKWLWDSDSRLIFTPATDWPASQTYTIQFNKKFFSPGSKMASLKFTFATLPFAATISEFKFYQDPVHAAVRQAVATIHFSFPVDTTSLEKNIRLQWQTLKNGKLDSSAPQVPFTLTYDEHKRTAYLHSENLELPITERYLQLSLSKNIKSSTNNAKLSEKVSVTLLIADAASYFKINALNTAIVRNQQDRPEQILTIETTLGVTTAKLASSVHAYLLPQDYPATAAEEIKPHYKWQNPGEVTEAILALAKPIALNTIPADQDFSALHSFKYNALTPAYLYVKIDKGLRGFGDFVLANPYTAIIKVPAYPQEITFLHKGALIALGTEEKLSVLVRGLNAVKFNIARVLPDNINHLITQTSGDFSNPYFTNVNFNQDNISEITSQIQTFESSDPGKELYTALDLSKTLSNSSNSGGSLGLFLLKAQAWDATKKTILNVQTSRLVLITNLGLIVKDNIDSTHDVFVQSITEGSPVKNASVAILGKNGLPVLTRTTDTNGHATFPSLKDFINEQEPTVYIVKNGNDVSFIPYFRHDRQLNYSRFDVGGITSNHDNPAALTAYIFSDRGIYRPGDIVHLGMIVKQPYVMPQPAGIPLEATVVDPRGITVKNVKLNLDETGYVNLDFQTSPTSPTGQYQINLNIVKDKHASSLIGSSTIHVAEFLPDRMRISAHLSQETTHGWISPADLTAKVSLWNLYGKAAVNHRVAGKILLNPHAVRFQEFQDYTFIDPLLNPKSPPRIFTDTLTETKTDNKGEAQFNLKLDRFEQATWQLTVFLEGFEAEGGRSVTTQVKTLVSPLAFLVGYKADGDLQYIKQDAPRTVHFIAINPQLKQQALSDLTLKLFSQHPVSTLVKKEDGTYQYQSILQTSEISSHSFNIAAQGTDYLLPANAIGDFLVTVSTQDGSELSRYKYSIVGKSQQPLPKNAELNVKLNKTEFTAGENIEMQITAPYTGTGLITIERDKVYASQWFKTDTTSSLQKIQLPNDFQGNGYINIAFTRDLNSPEIFMSPLSFSVLPFSVTHHNHEIQINLKTPGLARPGQALPISWQTDKKGKIIVFVVDEGILQVTRYQTPNPLDFFFQKHALEVNTLQILDQILPKFISERELSAVGGDEGENALKSNLNPFKRKTEAPVVYWSGILDTDATPRELTYQIPDYFNGSLRVMAVAVANDAVGSASQTTEVRGYFVINPNVPTFVAPHDEFIVTASIANNISGSGNHANIAVTLLSTPQLEIMDEAKQNLIIPEGQERSVHFSVRAKSQLGAAEMKFTATLANQSSAYSSTLSVRPAIPFSTTISSGYTMETKKSLAIDRQLYPEYRKAEASLSTSPLILITGIQRYLDDYPYGCVEQLVSKAFPWLVMANQPWFVTQRESVNDNIQKTIQMLSQRQLSSGGFSYWPDVGITKNDFASVYAMHFLTEARVQGYNIPRDVFSTGIEFLKNLASQPNVTLDDARLHAYAIYILTRNEIITSNYLTHLQLDLDQHSKKFAWHNDITSAYLAATWQLLKSSKEAEKIIEYYQPHFKNVTSSDFYNENIANAQYLYLIAKHFPARLQKLDTTLLMSLVDALNNNTMSTILSGYTTLALSAYQQGNTSSEIPSFSISEQLDDNKEKDLSLATGLYKSAAIDADTKNVIFNNPSKQAYFYQFTQAGFDKNISEKIIKQGMEVYREYRNINDKTITEIKAGDEIIVHTRIRATDAQYHTNVAIIDLLPGGFEVMRDSLASIDMDYVDSREDRVIFFGSVNPDSKELVYRIKATSAGKFIVPPIFAASMYNPMIKAMGLAETLSVMAGE